MILVGFCESPGHVLEGHVERPARVKSLLQQLNKTGAFDDQNGILSRHDSSRQATREEIGLVHTYYDDLKQKVGRSGLEDDVTILADEDDPDGCTYATHTTFEDACRACGVVLDLVDSICGANAGDSKACALVRPPGHHSTPTSPLGFCIFNNVAVAAKYAIDRYPNQIQRILIVDFDLHNGNGTVECFYEDDAICVVDIHEETQVYVGNDTVESIGAGNGVGYTINIPLAKHSGHASVVKIFKDVITPCADRHKPDLIIASAGFDGHKDDPFDSLSYDEDTYRYIGYSLSTLADVYSDGRVLFVLEGGYNTEALCSSVNAFLCGAADPRVAELAQEPRFLKGDEESIDIVDRVKQIHHLYN